MCPHECFRHRMEDELRFGADHYLKKMLERKSFLESFWGGIKVTCVFMALVSSFNMTNDGNKVVERNSD